MTTSTTAAAKKRAARTIATKSAAADKPISAVAKSTKIRTRPAAAPAVAKTKTTRVSATSTGTSTQSPVSCPVVCAGESREGAAAEALPLVDRVERSVEHEIKRIEAIVSGQHADDEQHADAERRARTLASLTRTLFELRRLRDTEEKRPLDDDTVPRDLDELRRALSRRLDQMVAGTADVPAAGDE
ncbi:hypothetical protein [Rhodopseudomonas sp. B29]|uniref:hypothetical protein n=1 Tax=Rhodopseudomonas sp. B29 TaxID=95607 RepID=UPI0011D1D149|nr:hypothetical protein [Rhodopseudomonas sp. B29]